MGAPVLWLVILLVTVVLLALVRGIARWLTDLHVDTFLR